MGNFLDRISIPGRNPNDYRAFPLNLALAGQATVHLEARSLFNPIFLVFITFGDLVHALLDVDMAGGTGTDATTGMLDVDPVLEGEFKQTLLLATHQLPFRGFGVGKAFGIFKNVFDGDDRWPVLLVAVLHMHMIRFPLSAIEAGGTPSDGHHQGLVPRRRSMIGPLQACHVPVQEDARLHDLRIASSLDPMLRNPR